MCVRHNTRYVFLPVYVYINGALQLLSNRHMYIRFAHVHERILFFKRCYVLLNF